MFFLEFFVFLGIILTQYNIGKIFKEIDSSNKECHVLEIEYYTSEPVEYYICKTRWEK